MTVIDQEFQKTLDRIGKRKWWPVAELAVVLGRPKKYVYRKIEAEVFCLIRDGGFMKVTSESVLGHFVEDE